MHAMVTRCPSCDAVQAIDISLRDTIVIRHEDEYYGRRTEQISHNLNQWQTLSLGLVAALFAFLKFAIDRVTPWIGLTAVIPLVAFSASFLLSALCQIEVFEYGHMLKAKLSGTDGTADQFVASFDKRYNQSLWAFVAGVFF
jgi:hypothetical protein